MNYLLKLFICSILVFMFSSSTFAAETKYEDRGQCGLHVLGKICEQYNIETTEEELKKLSNTAYGRTTMFGLIQALKAKGLDGVGVETDIRGLTALAGKYPLIVHYSGNHHFILVKAIDNKWIKAYDPLLTRQETKIPRVVFLKDWDGTVVVVGKGPELYTDLHITKEEKDHAQLSHDK